MKLNYKSYGDKGETVIIMHGIFGMLDNWHSFASQLSKSYKVLTIDHRNHGRSPHSDKFDYPSMVADLMEFIEDRGEEQVHIIGHSMGGKTAMHFALQYPDKVLSLTVLDIGIKYYPPRHDYIFSALCSIDLRMFESRNEINEHLSSQITNFAVRQFLIKNIKRHAEGGFTWKMNLPVIRENYNVITDWIPTGKSFDKKTLFVRGTNSSFILMEDWPGIQELFPFARLQSIPGAGHWLHAEKPYELLKVIGFFLNDEL
jgi:pimeloyl-ACP methyl ester carboxylesterase